MTKEKNTAYCGANIDIPKGKRPGTMRECAEKNQIRRYGIFKIDPDILKGKEIAKIKGANQNLLDKAIGQIIGTKTKVRMIEKDIEKKKKKKDEASVKKLRKDLEKAKKAVEDAVNYVNLVKAAIEKAKNAKKITKADIDKKKKSTTKTSRKSTTKTSKKSSRK